MATRKGRSSGAEVLFRTGDATFELTRELGSAPQGVRLLLARRYPAGRISYSLADIDAAAQSARLGLKLDSGALFRLGELKVTGLERYPPELVPRLARLPVGMVYDQEKIVRAQLRLAGSGYFDSAFIFVDPAGNPQAAPVQVNVREARHERKRRPKRPESYRAYVAGPLTEERSAQ